MKRAFFIIWAILIWQVGVWAFAPQPEEKKPPAIHPDNVGKAYGSTEKYTVDARISQRRSALDSLEMRAREICGEAGNKKFVSGLGEYFFHRQNQSERYPEIYGKLGADYIAKQWASPEDSRIDRLTQDFYRRGYIKPAEFNGVARKMIVEVVKKDRVEGRGCAG